jgi:hypothetical protein
MSSTIAAKNKKPGAKTSSPVITLAIASETWRFRAYVAFWGMCAFAIMLSKFVVAPRLLAGPKDGSTCAPFERSDPDLGDGVSPGEGFDLDSQSHLIQLFGFGNICTNWDYTPSRELTAMVYPLFEYSLIIYLCLDFCATTISYKKGELTEGFWMFSKIAFPVTFFLCSQFRMIFVVLAYVNVSGHTTGFLGLQVALILVAIQNTGYIYNAEISYDVVGGLKNTRLIALAYIIGDLIISTFKISATIFVVLNGRGAPWTLKPSPLPGKCIGEMVDIIWMIFNAVIPLIISHFRSKNEFPLVINITQRSIYIDGSSSGIEMTESEKKGLTSGGGGSHSKYESRVYENVRTDEVI